MSITFIDIVDESSISETVLESKNVYIFGTDRVINSVV